MTDFYIGLTIGFWLCSVIYRLTPLRRMVKENTGHGRG